MTFTMRAEVRDAWADALESGEYEQTKHVLATVQQQDDGHVVTGMCCLGVLCDLAVKAGAIPAPTVTSARDVGDCLQYGEGEYPSYTGLPPSVREWAGMERDDVGTGGLEDPMLHHPDGGAHSAARWNDEYNATFADIAVMVRLIPSTD